MLPLDHLEWAAGLPPCGDSVDLPLLLQEAVDKTAVLGYAGVASMRSEAKAFWLERKRVLDSEWAERFRTLPEHVQSVLGPKKNLLLLQEMLHACESPDVNLFHNLVQGFPLVGKLPRSGTLPPVEYEGTYSMVFTPFVA